MRVLVAAMVFTTFLAGCATQPSPIGDADAAHAGKSCPPGQWVQAFDAQGAPVCATAPSPVAKSCAKGEVVTGIRSDGSPVCESIYRVASAAEPETTHASQAAKTLSLTSAGAMDASTTPGKYDKSYAVAAASSGIRYAELAITVNGVAFPLHSEGACGSAKLADSEWTVCSNGKSSAAGEPVLAGDVITFRFASQPAGSTLRIIDANANSVILTLTLG